MYVDWLSRSEIRYEQEDRHKSLSHINELPSGGERKAGEEMQQQEETEAQENLCTPTELEILKFNITQISVDNMDGWGRCL